MKAYQLQSKLIFLTLTKDGWKGTLGQWQCVHERDEYYKAMADMKKTFRDIWK